MAAPMRPPPLELTALEWSALRAAGRWLSLLRESDPERYTVPAETLLGALKKIEAANTGPMA